MDGASEEDAEDKDGDEEVDGESPASDLASASCAARRREVKRLGAGESLNGLSGLDRGGVVSAGDASVGEPSRGGVRGCCMVVLLMKGRWISPAKLLIYCREYSQLVYAQAKLWKEGKGCAGRSADQQERQGELREQRMSKKGTLVRWCDLSLREGERSLHNMAFRIGHVLTWVQRRGELQREAGGQTNVNFDKTRCRLQCKANSFSPDCRVAKVLHLDPLWLSRTLRDSGILTRSCRALPPLEASTC